MNFLVLLRLLPAKLFHNFFLLLRDFFFRAAARNRVIVQIDFHETREERQFLRYAPPFFLFDKAIIGMALRTRPQFHFPKKLAEILPLVKPHPVRKRNDILREFGVERFDFFE